MRYVTPKELPKLIKDAEIVEVYVSCSPDYGMPVRITKAEAKRFAQTLTLSGISRVNICRSGTTLCIGDMQA